MRGYVRVDQLTVTDMDRFYASYLTVYVVYVNRVGHEDGIAFWGGSEIVAPDGSDVRVLLQLDRGGMAHFELAAGQMEISVRDRGGGIRGVSASHDRMGVGLAVISALADRSEFVNPPEGGTEVRMSFTGRGTKPALERAEAHDWPKDLDGDVVARLSALIVVRGLLDNQTNHYVGVSEGAVKERTD